MSVVNSLFVVSQMGFYPTNNNKIRYFTKGSLYYLI